MPVPSSFFVMSSMLPSCSPHSAEVSRATRKVDQAWSGGQCCKLVTVNGQNWDRDKGMNVGWKSNDSSLIFSGHLLFGFLPFCMPSPDIIFHAVVIVYIFFQGFHFMYIMFVFFTSPVWPALNTTAV